MAKTSFYVAEPAPQAVAGASAAALQAASAAAASAASASLAAAYATDAEAQAASADTSVADASGYAAAANASAISASTHDTSASGNAQRRLAPRQRLQAALRRRLAPQAPLRPMRPLRPLRRLAHPRAPEPLQATLRLLQAAPQPLQAARAASGSAATAASLLSFTAAGTGGVNRSLFSKLSDTVSVKDFGAVGDGTTNDTAAFNAALAAYETVIVPPGTYALGTAILMSKSDRNRLIGAGQLFTTLKNTNTSGAVIETHCTGIFEIEGLTLTRTATADASAHGIQQVATCGYGTIRDVFITRQHFGIVAGGMTYGLMDRCFSTANLADGILVVGTGGAPTQWQLTNIGVTGNDGNGILVKSFDNTNVTLGEPWMNITSYANTGYGICFQGSASYCIYDIAVHGGFLGSDGAGEILLDTYEGGATVPALISHIQLEAAGMFPTGSAGTTAASHTAHGIYITQNNTSVNLTGISINGVAQNGIRTSCPSTIINGASIVNCGQAAGERNGIYVENGTAVITNSSIGNVSSTRQEYGIVLGASSSHNMVMACNLVHGSGNALGALLDNSSPAGTNTIIGNKGYHYNIVGDQLATASTTVAGLPPSGGLIGARSFITDANQTVAANIGAIVAAGGGTNTVPVYCDGSNWRIG
jgi:hypothetical protein